MIDVLITLVRTAERVFTLVIIVDVLLSYFVSPYHPLRQFLDRLVEPLLAPIRRFIPAVASIDFSPLVLIILVQLIATVFINVLYFLR
jgi:YggT family protein